MAKIKRSIETVFIVSCVFGLFAAVLLVASNQPANAESDLPYAYPYPDPTKSKCGTINHPYIGPYPAGCVYLPLLQDNMPGFPPTATATPTPTPSPTPSPTPTNTPRPNPYP